MRSLDFEDIIDAAVKLTNNDDALSDFRVVEKRRSLKMKVKPVTVWSGSYTDWLDREDEEET